MEKQIEKLSSGNPTRYLTQMSPPEVEMNEDKYYQAVTEDKKTHRIHFDKIILFQSGSKSGVIEVHTEQDVLRVRGQITKVARVGSEFFSTFTSYTVNTNHIRRIHTTKREVELSNGRVVPIASSRIKVLLDRLPAHIQSV